MIANTKTDELKRLAVSIANDLYDPLYITCNGDIIQNLPDTDTILLTRLAERAWLKGCRRTDGNVLADLGKFARQKISDTLIDQPPLT